MGWDWAMPLMPYGSRWRRHRAKFQKHFHVNVSPVYQPCQVRETHTLLRSLLTTPAKFNHHIRRSANEISLYYSTPNFANIEPPLQSFWILPTVMMWLMKMIIISLLPMMSYEHLPKPVSSGRTWSTTSQFSSTFRHGCPERLSNGRLVNGVIYLATCLKANSRQWNKRWWVVLPFSFPDAQRTFRRKAQLNHASWRQSWRAGWNLIRV